MADGARVPPSVNAAVSWHAPAAAAIQPPLYPRSEITLHAAVASLALGGAERIVLDWAAAAAATRRIRLIVLRPASAAWSVPPGVEVIRLRADRPLAPQLECEGRAIAASGQGRVLCHLLKAEERAALARGGAAPIAVVHNARAGWIEDGSHHAGATDIIAVSTAAANELRAIGAHATVVRHFPRTPTLHADARSFWRARWCIPSDALCIGMIGGVKPQKAYPRAIGILAALNARRAAYLVILGGPTGRDGLLAWHASIAQAVRLGIADRVRLPGFVAAAAQALSAFDLLLNTSRYEGVSIATMEALAAGLPVVASAVGGQAEVPAPGLTLLPHDAPPAAWIDAVDASLARRAAPPVWRGFPSGRLWTLFHIELPRHAGERTVFVTANLNAGGAQRSLVNLAKHLHVRLPLEIAVCGVSTASDFAADLQASGTSVYRTAESRDCFDHAEALLLRLARGDVGRIVFWNADPKLKLLLSKRLAGLPIALIDVSPGAYAFEEMDATADFQTCIAHAARDYYAQLQRLVLKYADLPPVAAATAIIPNGVPLPHRMKQFVCAPRKVVVSGRIAPSKFLLEIVAAMRLVWAIVPDAELHILGTAEPRHREYSERVFAAIGDELGRRVCIHGAAFDAPSRLDHYDIALVLGHHQGSPNAVLEAMAAGLAVAANDSGGTKELVTDGRTGLLLDGCEPRVAAQALLRLMADMHLTKRLARAGHERVRRRHSMTRMAASYEKLLKG